MINNLAIAVNAFARCMFTSLYVDEVSLPMYVNLFTNFRGRLFWMEMVLSLLNLKPSVLFAFTWSSMLTAHSSSCRYSAWVGVFAGSDKNLQSAYIIDSSTSCLFQRKDIFFYEIYQRSTYFIEADYKQIWCQWISLLDYKNNVEEVYVFIRWATFCLPISIKCHYSCNSFFKETLC